MKNTCDFIKKFHYLGLYVHITSAFSIVDKTWVRILRPKRTRNGRIRLEH